MAHIVGSLVLGALYETEYLWKLSAPLAPVVEGWLGLPAVAGLTLIFAILRKELALQLLVSTIYIPCVSTIAMLARELSWKRAITISSFTVSLAILVGGVANKVLLVL